MSTAILRDPAFVGAPEFPGAKVHGFSAALEDPGKGNWPRMIDFSDDVKNRLTAWIDSELEGFYLERGPMLEQWKKWQTLYWAEPETAERTFPFKRAANIVIPLASIAVEAIHARIMNTLFSVSPFYSIRPMAKEWITAAKPFEKFLQSEINNKNTLDLYGFCQETTLELVKLGTCVGKTSYERLTKKSLRKIGDREEDFYVTTKNGATVERVPLFNFIMRLNETDPQLAPLVGEEHEFTWAQLKRMAQDGRMNAEAIESIKTQWQMARMPEGDPNSGTEVQAKIEELARAEPAWTDVFKIHELWCLFDVDGDGWDEEIVVDYHKASRTFLSARYNWNDDLHRPYHLNQYIKVEGVWTGIGVCKQTEQFQAEATTIHRQRLDNATLANMKMIALSKNSDYTNGEAVFPGKQWFLNDPSKDIREVSLSEVYPSSYANEDSVVRYWEKSTGANEVVLGIPQSGTPGTATSDLTRLAEGNKKFDLVLKNCKRWLSGIGVDIITNYQIFGDQQVHWMIMGEDGGFVENVLNMPSILVRKGAIVSVTVSDSVTNKEVEQRQAMTLFQLVTGYYQQVLQMAQLFGPEAMLPLAQKAMVASDEAMRRLLETFQITDSDRYSLVEETPNGQPGSTPGTNGQNPGGPAAFGFPLVIGSGGATDSSVQSRVGNLPSFNGATA